MWLRLFVQVCLWQIFHTFWHLITSRCSFSACAVREIIENRSASGRDFDERRTWEGEKTEGKINGVWLTSLRDTLGTGSVVVVMSISPSISDISSENPFGMVVSPLLPFCDWFFGDDFLSDFTCRFCNTKRPITSVKHSSTPTVTDMNKYRKNFSWFSAKFEE